MMVDTPLDLIWRFREQGCKVCVDRVTFGEAPHMKYGGPLRQIGHRRGPETCSTRRAAVSTLAPLPNGSGPLYR